MDKMDQIIDWITHDYLLITIAAVVFFAAKSFIGYLTYRKFMKELRDIKELIRQSGQDNQTNL